jgi:RHS repeat-associated protein
MATFSRSHPYPGGMVMPDRKYTGPNYRFGFNGKEKDDAVKGAGAEYDYGFRIYDPRYARFLSVDPLSKSYPFYTPYQFAGNKPINSTDLDGLEEKEAYYYYSKDNAGLEHITYMEIPLQQHQQRPEFGNVGTLTKFYIQNPSTGKTDYHEAYEKPANTDGFFDNLFSKNRWFPQIQIFGSGTEAQGGKVDYSRPLHSFNLSTDETFELLLTGTYGPEQYGPLSETDKYEEGVRFLNSLKEEATKKVNENTEKKMEPVVIEETKEGEWEYYIRSKSGSEGRYKSSDPPYIVPGKEGAPDTTKKVKYIQPPIPKHNIPRKKE